MNEYFSVVARFVDDLRALGIPRPRRAKAMSCYIDALFVPSPESWLRFYQQVSEMLQQWPGEPFDPDAAQRLFSLIDDDLGRTVSEVPVRARLRGMLLQHRIAS